MSRGQIWKISKNSAYDKGNEEPPNIAPAMIQKNGAESFSRLDG
jgi:hypothetical protein